MAIPIKFFTVILKKQAIQAAYPGGLTHFLQDYMGAPEDDQLVGLSFMSGSDLQQFIDLLSTISLDLSRDLAIGERFHGEWQACPGI